MRKTLLLSIVLLLTKLFAYAQNEKKIALSSLVGEEIDITEKLEYHLFPYFDNTQFVKAIVYKETDSTYVIEALMKNGQTEDRYIGQKELSMYTSQINGVVGDITSQRRSYQRIGLHGAFYCGMSEAYPQSVLFRSTTKVGYNNVYGSFGAGFRYGGRLEYDMNSIFSMNLTLEYLKSNTVSASDVENNNSYNFDFSTSMLRLMPGVKFACYHNETAYYLLTGLILGISSPMVVDITGVDNNSYQENVENGGFSYGVHSSIGVNIPLYENKAALFFELQFIAQTYSPEKGEVIKYEVKGQDQLGNISTSNKSYDFTDDYYGINNNVPPHLKRYYPFSSVGLNLGLRF